jgi:putative nucleotidyltransferase with HDIG domain
VYVRPNIVFDPNATSQAMTSAIDAVPRTIGYVQESERIVSKHERITDETILKLESLQRARADRRGEDNLPGQVAGIMLHVLIILVLYGIYLGLFRKRIFWNSRKLMLIALLIAIQGFFAYLTREIETDLPLEFLIAVPVTSMLLAILFDSRVAFYGTVVVAFLVAAIRGNDYSIALASLVAGALSVYTVRDIRNRTQIFRSMGFIFLGYGVSILALALERYAEPGRVSVQISLALVNSLISPVLTYGLLIFFERVFRMTTDLTLIELSDFNHPLLRQLSEKAPGTYHHSMTMASLAENAARAIGANDILARTGAYFHDIGKLSKPTYFVENQRGTRSRHDRLPARTSAAIIQDHVSNGIALARQYGLPEELIDFIPMHHGTTMTEFFYSKAMKEAGADGDSSPEIREGDFRYRGPKPQTKETGILMLADDI